MKVADNAPFQKSLLSKGSTRWKSFATGAVAQIMLAGMGVALPLILPHPLHPNFQEYAVVDVRIPRMPKPWDAPPSHPGKSSQNQRRAKRQNHLSLAGIPTTISVPVLSAPVLASAQRVRRVAAPNLIVATRVPELPLKISAIPRLQAPRAQIQTGDFAYFEDTAADRGPAGSGPSSAIGRAADRPSMASPVIILFKPKPRYTFDALTSKVQGDVLLTVLFSASGSVKVLSIIHHLGYGLDESAETAADQIRFRPARNREGIPIDITAIVRASFNLSDCGAGCLTATTNE